MRDVDLITLAKIDLLKGKVDCDLDSLSKILLDNYQNKFECEIDSTYFEDSICPPNDIVDDIIILRYNLNINSIQSLSSFL